jgi:Carboxypeptidase regulatory-like domain
MNGITRVRSAIIAGLLATWIDAIATAQSPVTGAIAGTVTDESGRAMQVATVLARDIDRRSEVSAATDSEGYFRIVGLQPGRYTLEVNGRDVASVGPGDPIVSIGRVTLVNISLGSAPDHVASVDTLSQGLTLNQTQAFDDLPNNGRRWSNFALLAPATAPDGALGAVSFRGTTSLLNNISIDGGDNTQAFVATERGGLRIAYGIGLASIGEVAINGSNYSAEYGRATGGVLNAITKSGTNTFRGSAFFYDRDNKWGARNPRGFQSVSSNGATAIVPLKPVDQRFQFGGTAGGPIIKNRVFFFGSYDQQRRRFPAVSTMSDPAYLGTVDRGTTGTGLKAPERGLTDAQIDATLAFLTSLTGEVQRRGDQIIYTPRLDWQITSRHALKATYNRMRWESPAGVDTAPTSNRGRASFGDEFVALDWLTLGLVSRIRPRVVNELRGQLGRDNQSKFSQTPAPGEPLTGPHGQPPSIALQGGITFGKPPDLDARAFPDERRWQVADAVTTVLTNHTIKAGFDLTQVRTRRDNLAVEEGSYTYSNLNDFIVDYVNFTAGGTLRASGRRCASFARIAGKCYAASYTQAFGRPSVEFTTNDLAFFVEDDYRVTSRLTVNLGVRYQSQHLPEPQLPNPLSNLPGQLLGPEQTQRFASDAGDVEPRLGFAYDVRGTGKTILRGGYGTYHGRILNVTIGDAISRTGVRESQTAFQFNPSTNPDAPVFPDTFSSAPLAEMAAPNIGVFDPDMQRPLAHQTDVVLEHELRANTVFSVAYLFSAGRNLPTLVDVNLPAPTSRSYTIAGGDFDGQTLTVSPFFMMGPRPDTRFGTITAFRSVIESDYHGLVLQVNGRVTDALRFDSSYTLSKAADNGQSSTSFTVTNYPSNPLDVSADQGPSDFDVRHKFTAAATLGPLAPPVDHRLTHALTNGLAVSTVIVAMSGEPYSAGAGVGAPGGLRAGIAGAGGGLSRFPLYPRNAFRLPTIINVDLRVSRRFRIGGTTTLEVLAEAFNLFNRTQVTEVNTRMYVIGGTVETSTLTFDPAFQTVRSAGNNLVRERQLQFAARVAF